MINGFYDVKDKVLDLRLEDFEDIVIVHMSGELNTYNSDFFTKRIQLLLNSSYNKFIFSMAKISYVSSTGIGAFSGILRIVSKTHEREMALANVSSRVFEVFQLLGFSTFFNKFDNISNAISYFKSGINPIFPAVLSCPTCFHKLKASKSGKFRCPSCKKVVIIDSNGSIFLE